MLEADLFADMGVFDQKAKPIVSNGPLRPNNDAFWLELSQIAQNRQPNQQE